MVNLETNHVVPQKNEMAASAQSPLVCNADLSKKDVKEHI